VVGEERAEAAGEVDERVAVLVHGEPVDVPDDDRVIAAGDLGLDRAVEDGKGVAERLGEAVYRAVLSGARERVVLQPGLAE